MAIGLGSSRTARRGRAGRMESGKDLAGSTVREVCLIGLDRGAGARDWTTGQEIRWLGRKYQVVGTAVDSQGHAPTCGVDGQDTAPTRRYVHLARCHRS